MSLVASELTDKMQEAFKTEWQVVKGTPLPEAGGEDRRLLFAAVAHGLLEYLRAHKSDIITAITFQDQGVQSVTHNVTNTEINISRE